MITIETYRILMQDSVNPNAAIYIDEIEARNQDEAYEIAKTRYPGNVVAVRKISLDKLPNIE